jgi:hypothetical protein
MKYLIIIVIAASLFIGCENPQDPFLVQKHNIGSLTDSTQVKDLEMIYASDSIVKFIGGDEFTGNINTIDIYETGGVKLLELTPSQALDSTAVIENVRIMDARYRTEKNVSLISTFKDIADNYTISRIDNLINSAVVSVNEINASFTIDKKELPANVRFDMELQIEETQIPDDAKIKYFMINWQ